jgi:hypothetical protein
VPSRDEDSPQLRLNLTQVLREIVLAALRREYPTLASAKRWQTLAMKDLTVPDSRFVGCLRPRPNSGYAAAGAKAMQRDWKLTATSFQRLLARLYQPRGADAAPSRSGRGLLKIQAV